MLGLTKLSNVPSRPETPLESLLARAEQYGRVGVHPHSEQSERYHVWIKFRSITGIDLEAKSDHGLPIHQAFEQAIERAELIRSQFK
ncbi:MAG TPA: hypothetical protein VK181_11860 [Rhizobium sp.]|nr:hypothetical protein [Rhizobium sp.]